MKNGFKIEPRKYEFLWRVKGVSYFGLHTFLSKKHLSWDLIFSLNYRKNRELNKYIGVTDLKKCEKIGLSLMKDTAKLDNYYRRVKFLTAKTKKVFREIRGKNFSMLSDNVLAAELRKAFAASQNLWALYFYTENFFYGEVESILADKRTTKSFRTTLIKNIERLQKIKFDMRILLNETMFGDDIFGAILREIRKRFSITRSKSRQLGPAELIELLTKKDYKPSYKTSFVVGKITGWQAITGRKAMEIISNFDKYFDDQVKNEISGKTGNKGYFKGRVRVIHFEVKGQTIKEINKMKRGEVLVSESTGPEMILACRKAGAIVTEQGGITSHAALVSRELGIPCVIGTKIATKVLKDGDLVEVDANKGIVKILNN